MTSSEKKTTRIIFKCTPKEKADFHEKCNKLGFRNGSQYIRYCLNNQNIVVLDSSKITSELYKISEDLHRVGSNLNQLSRAYYSNGSKDSERLSESLIEYDMLTKQLNKAFKQANKLYKESLSEKGGGNNAG